MLRQQQHLHLATPTRDLQLHNTPEVQDGVMSLSARQLLAVAEDIAKREADKWAARLNQAEHVSVCTGGSLWGTGPGGGDLCCCACDCAT
jgi:hypothetical protein